MNDIIDQYIKKIKKLFDKINQKDIDSIDDDLKSILSFPEYYRNVLKLFTDIIKEMNKLKAINEDDKQIIDEKINKFKNLFKDIYKVIGQYNILVSQHWIK